MKFLAVMLLGFSFLFSAVDINTADEKGLLTLKGIGKKKVQNIIEYRKENCFKHVVELANVKGIGKKTLEINQGNLEVSECK